MSRVTNEAEIRKALEVVIDPELHRSIVELDMVRSIEIGGERSRRRDGLADDAGLPDQGPLPDRRRRGRWWRSREWRM